MSEAASSSSTQKPRKGVNVKDIEPEEFIRAFAAHLKKSGNFELPKWVDLVKTGTHRELAPQNPDWYYIRAASIARKVYLRPCRGVGLLSHTYGGATKSGTRRSHHRKAARGIIRHCLQQLQELGLVQVHGRGGRAITDKGRKELDLVASAVARRT